METRNIAITAALFLLFVIAVYAGLALGAVNFTISDLSKIIFEESNNLYADLFWKIRFPRVAAASLTGAALAVSGVILQSIMRNPLASPEILGISAGGGLAAIIIILLLPHLIWLLTPAAFIGSFSTALLVYAISWKNGAQPIRMILSGVAISSMFAAIISLLLLLNSTHLSGVLDFTSGSLYTRDPFLLKTVSIYIIFGLALAFCFSEHLNILQLGDESAATLGINIEKTRFFLTALAALLAAAAVSIAGLIGFAGLIAPHTTRLLTGSNHRILIPCSIFTGAFLVIVCDLAGRFLFLPAELPCGVLLSLFGPPFFLALLLKKNKGHNNANNC